MDSVAQMARPSSDVVLITEAEEVEAVNIDSITYTNLATCFLKLGNSQKALDNANEACSVKPIYWKAFLRKAEAQLLFGDVDRALSTLATAESLLASEEGEAVATAATSPSSSRAAISEVRQRAARIEREAVRAQKEQWGGFLNKVNK